MAAMFVHKQSSTIHVLKFSHFLLKCDTSMLNIVKRVARYQTSRKLEPHVTQSANQTMMTSHHLGQRGGTAIMKTGSFYVCACAHLSAFHGVL